MKVEKNINERGITLVALIITIIILVILTAVTIKSVFNFGIIDLAATSAGIYEREQQREANELKEIEAMIKEMSGDFVVMLAGEETTIGTARVIANVVEKTSEIVSYRFDYKKSGTDEEWTEGEEIKREETKCEYTYTNLERGTKYDVRVTVKDDMGRVAESSVEEVTTEPNHGPSIPDIISEAVRSRRNDSKSKSRRYR